MRSKAVMLALIALVAFSAVVYRNQPEPLIPDSDAARLAYKIDLILDGLPEQKIPATQRSLVDWVYEILPYFEYEGVISRSIPPDSVTLTAYLDAMEHNHVLGRAMCSPVGGGPVEINARVGNPVSSWYGDPGFLATLVHELGHVQGGGLCSEDSAKTESTTQIVTLEVMAAMVNGGNTVALYGLLDELRAMLMGAVHYEALAGKVEGWKAFRTLVFSTPSERARTAKSERRWAKELPLLKEILYKYSFVPVRRVLAGLKTGRVPGLVLGDRPFDGTMASMVSPYKPRSLVIDDLAYVLEHVGELAPAAAGTLGPHVPKREGI